ncbi:hypothetical protein DM01DRAFT_1332795 [Hesseltinella vesiculosa]|uniref:Uncharacterized protein n=1 Tax=Hesseltinella vesiculosa TaxID=101127 RepID=A0A1X2GT71_9FUNG|nr:hypothetical protein DM01DRAFT_1332795 [Hesseltinella vesiculosa]
MAAEILSDPADKDQDMPEAMVAADSQLMEALAVKHSMTQKILDTTIITDREKASLPRWFENPIYSERYMSMRNRVWDIWQKRKPRYVKKSSAIKSIGRVGSSGMFGDLFKFLEREGYINVNPIKDTKRMAAKPIRKSQISKVPPGYQRTKMKKMLATWADPDLSQRQNIQEKRDAPVAFYSLDEQDDDELFQLVPLKAYSSSYPAPFKVVLKADVMAVMDFHAHLVTTEVMGLLGGSFSINDQGEKTLAVKRVFPCKSSSTDIQCEMDEQSHVDALNDFEERGLCVVGWYHSHPTFRPSPSIQDVNTQMSYQELFKDKLTGDEPFIGVIINPYRDDMAASSWFSYVHISPKPNPSKTDRQPFACDKVITPFTFDELDGMMELFGTLVDRYRDNQE